jgi:membrane-bound ClpP family serine protease
MGSLVQIAGALAILTGFALAQWGVLDQRSRLYLVLNLVGAAVLTVDAYVEAQWGFFLLEGVWSLIAGWGLVRTRPRAAAHA